MQIIREVLQKRMHEVYLQHAQRPQKDFLQIYQGYHLEVNIKILWRAFGKIESEPKTFPLQ